MDDFKFRGEVVKRKIRKPIGLRTCVTCKQTKPGTLMKNRYQCLLCSAQANTKKR